VKTPPAHQEKEGSRASATATLRLVERAPPSAALASVAMEQWLLGALLVHSGAGAFERVTGIVTAADFYVLDHGAIFSAIAQLLGRGQPVDVVTVTAYMEQASPARLASAGGPGYLAELVQNAPSTLHVDRYAQVVRERAHSRRLDALATDLSRSLREPGGKSLAEIALEARARISEFTTFGGHQVRAFTAHDFLEQQLAELEVLLAPWLFQKNLVMIHSRRGVGKTHFALGCAYAIAAGGKCLGWQAPKPHGVLYVDGEMPAQLLQGRLRELASGGSMGELPAGLRIVTPDLQDKPMPDLATLAGQAEIDALVNDDTALIVIDNLSCLVRSGGDENDAQSWGSVAEWALKHRRAGRAMVFVHHSGKTGAQRGTSKREDLLDVVINLRRPPEYEEQDGAVFDIYFEKGRSLTGEDIQPIRAQLLQDPGGGYTWSVGAVSSANQARVLELWEGGGLTLIDVARELGIDKSYAHRTLERAMKEGKLRRAYPARRKKWPERP
jgi:replicative DNA helicase